MNSLLSGLLVIIATDTGGQVSGLLQAFNTQVQQTSDIQEVAAAGLQLQAGLIAAAPAVESKLIKDVTNLLVTDAVAAIAKLQSEAVANANPAPASTPPAAA